MMKRLLALTLACVMLLGLFGCGKKAEETDLSTASWDEIVAAAKGEIKELPVIGTFKILK